MSYNDMTATSLFKKGQSDNDFLNGVLNTQISSLFSNGETDSDVANYFNSINIKSTLSYLRDSLVAKPTDKKGYYFQRMLVMLFGSPDSKTMEAAPLTKQLFS